MKKAGLYASVSLAVSVVASPAWAQAEAGAESAKAEAGDIVVTAQRREERLIDVPVSVAVTSGDTLQQLGFTSATDLQFTTPGLTFGDSNTPRGAGFRIRGVGTVVFADAVEQSVGTVVDGIPLARAGQGLADLVDIERVEVLKGPQGLLFGRNASAGLINITTKRPTDDFSFAGQVSYGTDDEVLASASVAGPIAGSALKGRLTGFYNRRDGFVRNVTTGERLNGRNEYGFRAQLLFAPDDSGFEAILRADYSKRDVAAGIWTARAYANAQTDPRPVGLAGRDRFTQEFAGGIVPGPKNRLVNTGKGLISNQMENWGASIEANIPIGDLTLTSLTAYRKWKQADNNDADGTQINIFDRNFGSNDLDQFSQELRLTSPAGGTVEFVAGLFFYLTDNDAYSEQAGRLLFNLNALLPPGLRYGRQRWNEQTTTDYAAFGQATIHATDRLNLIAGARITRTSVEMKWRRLTTAGALPGPNNTFLPYGPFSVEARDTNLSWRLGAQYEVTPTANLYATVTRGYKGPGFNSALDLPTSIGQTNAAFNAFTRVAPEIPTSYEAGFKATIPSIRTFVSLSGFWTDFKNFQAQVFETIPGSPTGAFTVRNAGKLRTRGFELEVDSRPAPGLNLGGSLVYNDAKFREFVGAGCPRLGSDPRLALPAGQAVPANICVPGKQSFDASGTPLVNAPKWTFTLNGRYEADLGGVKPFIQANYLWRSSVIYSPYPANIPNATRQPSYGILNGAVGASFAEGRVTASVFARNLLDQNYVTSIFDLPFDQIGGLGQFVTQEAARTVGVQLRVDF